MKRQAIERLRGALIHEDRPRTILSTDIGGEVYTVAISNDAIAHGLHRPDAELMVEECSDFVSAHRAEIVHAAEKSLARRGTIDGRILLVTGDL